jgi:hypothetical protein
MARFRLNPSTPSITKAYRSINDFKCPKIFGAWFASRYANGKFDIRRAVANHTGHQPSTLCSSNSDVSPSH